MTDLVRERLKTVPHRPGCYIMRDRRGEIIYVGKAKDLRRRVSSYFRPGARHAPKVRSMVDTVYDFEFMTVRNEAEVRLRDEFAGGFKMIAEHRGMLVLILVFVVGLMAYGPFDDLMPLLVSSVFGGDGYAASICTGAFGAGLLAGSAGMMAIGEKVPLTRIIAGCAVALSILILVCGLMPGTMLPLLAVCTGLSGGCCAGFAGPATTLLQKNCDPEYLGRVMGVFNSAMALGMPIGTGVGGTIAALTGVQPFFMLDGAAMLVIGMFAVFSKSLCSLDGKATPTTGPETVAHQSGDIG